MTGEQEIGNPILNHILMTAVRADQLALRNMRLQQKTMQIS
jgi:hypothetical protein